MTNLKVVTTSSAHNSLRNYHLQLQFIEQQKIFPGLLFNPLSTKRYQLTQHTRPKRYLRQTQSSTNHPFDLYHNHKPLKTNSLITGWSSRSSWTLLFGRLHCQTSSIFDSRNDGPALYSSFTATGLRWFQLLTTPTSPSTCQIPCLPCNPTVLADRFSSNELLSFAGAAHALTLALIYSVQEGSIKGETTKRKTMKSKALMGFSRKKGRLREGIRCFRPRTEITTLRKGKQKKKLRSCLITVKSA